MRICTNSHSVVIVITQLTLCSSHQSSVTKKKDQDGIRTAKKAPSQIKLCQAFYQRGSEGHNVQPFSWPSTQLT